MKSELNNFLVSIQLNPIFEFNAVYSMLHSNLYLLLIVLFNIRWYSMKTLSSLLIVFEWHLPNATLLSIFRQQFLFVAATLYCQLNRFGIQTGMVIFNKAKCRSICLDDLNYYLFVFFSWNSVHLVVLFLFDVWHVLYFKIRNLFERIVLIHRYLSVDWSGSQYPKPLPNYIFLFQRYL